MLEKYFCFSCCLLFACLSPLNAQQTSTKDLVLANEKKFSDLQIQRKCDEAVRLLDAEQRGISVGVSTRSEFLSQCKSGDVIPTRETFSHVDFALLTPDTALVTYADDAGFLSDGRLISLKANVASVWVKRGSDWLLNLHTASSIPFAIAEEGRIRLLYPDSDSQHDEWAGQHELASQIVALEHKYWEAWRNKDAKTLAEIRADDFREADQDGVSDKKQAAQGDSDMEITSYALTNEKVAALQPAVALLTYEAAYKGSYKGKDISSPHAYVVSVYMRRNGDWRLTYSQETAAKDSDDKVHAARSPVNYGSNPAAGNTFTHDGVKLYYEVYGSGEPILLVHGGGLGIASFKAQIEYFRQHYKVIAMDSRDQGRSGDSPDKLTYEKMTDDLAALLDHLRIEQVYVLGWSDGGIEALLLGIRHPAKVKKIAAMAANLNPQGLYPEISDWARKDMDSMSPAEKQTPDGKRELKLGQMALTEPNIDPKALERISAPTLVLSGDHDIIHDEHTVEMYHHLPNGELCIFPGATHAVPYDDPVLFNTTVDHFFQTPFVKKDRLNDLLKSMDALQKAE